MAGAISSVSEMLNVNLGRSRFVVVFVVEAAFDLVVGAVVGCLGLRGIKAAIACETSARAATEEGCSIANTLSVITSPLLLLLLLLLVVVLSGCHSRRTKFADSTFSKGSASRAPTEDDDGVDDIGGVGVLM